MLLVLFLATVSAECVQYQENNPPFYCDDIVLWDVAQQVYEDRWNRSKDAYELYYNLKTKYQQKDDDEDDPSLKCLAVARQFYCAFQFPYCTTDQPLRGICDFLCDIWNERCPEEPYDTFCGNSESEKCSGSKTLLISVVFLMFW